MIYRTKWTSNFSTIGNEIYKDKHLSWRAMGMLSYLLSKPENWEIHPKALKKATAGTEHEIGLSAIYDTLKELKNHGYVRMSKSKNGEVSYSVYDTPQSTAMDDEAQVIDNKPDITIPDLAEPDLAEPDLVYHHALIRTDVLKRTDIDKKQSVNKHTQQPLSNLDREATPQPAQAKPAPRQAGNSSALPETELCVCKEAFEKLWQESPLPKINKTKAEREFIALWEERGSERMKGGVPHIIADLKRRAESVKNYDSPFWRTSLATHIREKRWIDEDMPARFRSRL